jgi:hypothetical protein
MTQAAKGRTAMSHHSVVDEILAAISQLPVSATVNTLAAQSSQPSSTQSDSPLLNLAPDALDAAKSLIISLHVIFPHELLPALDLLDRGLVNKVIQSTAEETSSEDQPKETDPRIETSINEDINISSSQGTASTPKTAPRQGPSPNSQGTTITQSNLYYVQSASATSHVPTPVNNPSALSSDTAPSDSGSTWNPRRRGTQTYYEIRLDSWNCTCAAFSFSVLKSLGVAEDVGPEAFEFRGIGVHHNGTETEEDGKGPDDGDEDAGVDNIRGLDGQHDDQDGKNSALEQDLDEAEQEQQNEDAPRPEPSNTTTNRFGGTLTLPLPRPVPISSTHSGTPNTIPAPTPICKHILAALLADAAPNIFIESAHVQLLEMEREEVAAWAGGWGDG